MILYSSSVTKQDQIVDKSVQDEIPAPCYFTFYSSML